ncbi:polysaccharide deacetylase family protein [Thermococcus sp. SY098]|uniref:polysaccharide deacetylase family protein n=1 Tax=Thermococcus sp. SY098 TaxID=3111325 RepID=UPI002D79D57F|nr:polysaccharide deacetylase family protein [Thermococcus sp. SY098]WRS52956.1 polysaccharide deacetylase family protein [Thermococcus sp. SY098]
MLVSLTFDVEQDCPPYLNTTRGMEEGLPKILDLLSEKNVRATFFFTAEMARKYPNLAKRIVDEGHELACHGFNHERFDKLEKDRADLILEKALNILREFGDVVSFRAPNLQFPDYLFPALSKNGILLDSSKARYKGYKGGVKVVDGVLEVPVSITSSILRLPWSVQKVIHKKLREPRIYFAHPWEFVSMKKERIRFDCRFNTGDKALMLLERLIDYYKTQNAKFVMMREYLNVYQEI